MTTDEAHAIIQDLDGARWFKDSDSRNLVVAGLVLATEVARHAAALETVALIEELRADGRITICSDCDPSVFGATMSIGIWNGAPETVRWIYGANLLDCLRQAAEAKRVATKSA